MFWVVILFEFWLTHFMLILSGNEVFSAIFGMTPLPSQMIMVGLGFGVIGLVINVAIKFLPMKIFQYICIRVNLEKNHYLKADLKNNCYCVDETQEKAANTSLS